MLGAYRPSLLIVPIMSNYLCAPIDAVLPSGALSVISPSVPSYGAANCLECHHA
jgi:hypothetical protein